MSESGAVKRLYPLGLFRADRHQGLHNFSRFAVESWQSAYSGVGELPVEGIRGLWVSAFWLYGKSAFVCTTDLRIQLYHTLKIGPFSSIWRLLSSRSAWAISSSIDPQIALNR